MYTINDNSDETFRMDMGHRMEWQIYEENISKRAISITEMVCFLYSRCRSINLTNSMYRLQKKIRFWFSFFTSNMTPQMTVHWGNGAENEIHPQWHQDHIIAALQEYLLSIPGSKYNKLPTLMVTYFQLCLLWRERRESREGRQVSRKRTAKGH